MMPYTAKEPLPEAAEHFTREQIEKFMPVGSAWNTAKTALEEFMSIITPREGRAADMRSKMMLVYGRFGTGKSLIARKLAITFFRTYGFIVPVMLPLRQLSEALGQHSQYQGLRGLDASLAWYLSEGYARLIERDKALWAGTTIDNEKVNRLEILEEIHRKDKPNTLRDLSEAFKDRGLLGLIILDETEAVVTPKTRDRLYEFELSKLVMEVFSNAYTIANGGYPSTYIIMTSVLEPTEWVMYVLTSLARAPTDRRLVSLVEEMGIIHGDDVRRITEQTSINERLKEANSIASRVKHSFMLARPEVVTRIDMVKLYYTKDDYAEFIENRLGLSFDTPGDRKALTMYFHAAQLALRTLIKLAQRAHGMGIQSLSIENIGTLITYGNLQSRAFLDAVSRLVQAKVFPSHSKWPKRLLMLIETGAIILPSPENFKTIPNDEWKVHRKLYRRLFETFFERKAEGPLMDTMIHKVDEVLRALYHKYGVVRLLGGYYVVDEYIVRWFLGDPIDEYGRIIAIEEYLSEAAERGRRGGAHRR